MLLLGGQFAASAQTQQTASTPTGINATPQELVGAYDLVKRPDGSPQWIIRVQLTALFPTGR
jgi:hypothetical protein